jgi:hypothetical protein
MRSASRTLCLLAVALPALSIAAQHDHGAHPVAAAQLEIRDDAASSSMLLRVGPFNLPARTDHMDAEQAPDSYFEVPFDGWTVAYVPRMVDEAGGHIPGRLLHHVALWNTERSDFLCPNKEEHIFGAGGEMNEWPAVPGFGYPVRRGERIRVNTMVHNPTAHSFPAAYLEVHIAYRRAGQGEPLRSVYPAWFDVRECGSSSYDLPAGRDERTGRFRLTYGGTLLGVGGHLHDYGQLLELRHVTRDHMIATLAADLDPSGLLRSMPIADFSDRGGVRLNKDDEVAVTAVYDNPGPHLPRGAMGIVVGYFLPDDDAEMAALRRPRNPAAGGAGAEKEAFRAVAPERHH